MILILILNLNLLLLGTQPATFGILGVNTVNHNSYYRFTDKIVLQVQVVGI